VSAALVVTLTSMTGVAAQSLRIPLQSGLIVVSASNWPDVGDQESIKRIVEADERGVTVAVTADTTLVRSNPLSALLGGQLGGGVKEATRPFRARRTVRRDDLRTALEYRQIFEENAPLVFPGTTALGPSSAVLTALKTKGDAAFTVSSYAGAGSGAGIKASGTIRIVKNGTSSVIVLVNGAPTPLPVIHARGTLSGTNCEFFFLDDEDNPLALRFSIGENRLHVVRIEFPVAASTIQQQLASTGKADVYGIYFDFASDRIKEESEPVLAEIARVLAGNPAWTLNVHGHTDNIGSDASNLDLSTRRAAAVKQALVARYKIAPARLSTGGFGESRPIETNDTLEGRARNRRVELRR
jgi:flagellar motor protein MotB